MTDTQPTPRSAEFLRPGVADSQVRSSRGEDLAGKVALVTGGSSGIGRGIALALGGEGMTVIVTGRRAEHLEQTVAEFAERGLTVQTVTLDVTDRPGVQAAADAMRAEHGRLDILINNAGIGLVGGTKESTADDWDWVIDVNLSGVGNCIRAFLPLIREHGDGGHIVNTTSMAGLFPNVAPLYSMTKAGLIALSEAMNIELADEGIHVAAYCPGPVRSNIADNATRRPEKYGDSGWQPRGDTPDPESMPYMTYQEAGQRVLAGILRRDMFILTHPEFKAGVAERFEAILGAFPDEPINEERHAAIRFLTGHAAYGEDLRKGPPPPHA